MHRKKRYRERENPLKGVERPNLQGANCYKAHAVICINLNRRYDTINDAIADTGVRQSTISQCCCGRACTGGAFDNSKYIWMYAEHAVYFTEDDICKYMLEIKRPVKSRFKKRVKCITTGEEFDSVKDACFKYKISIFALFTYCEHEDTSIGCGVCKETKEALVWMYITD